MDDRIPAHLEVNAIIRAVQAEGGFATVLSKGERHAGTLMVICCENGTNSRVFERMPQLDGTRKWVLSKEEDIENPTEISDYLMRRAKQDDDLWVLEIDAVDATRFLPNPPSIG